MSEKPQDKQDQNNATGVSRVFDIRLVIGAVLTIYGIALTINGLVDNKASVAKAAGIRINLWTGIGLLVVGVFFIGWMRLLPLAALPPDDSADDLEKPPDAGGA